MAEEKFGDYKREAIAGNLNYLTDEAVEDIVVSYRGRTYRLGHVNGAVSVVLFPMSGEDRTEQVVSYTDEELASFATAALTQVNLWEPAN